MNWYDDTHNKEKIFETNIEESLLTHGGYVKGSSKDFNKKLALNTSTLLKFIRSTQPKQWEKFVTIHGVQAEEKFLKRLCDEIHTYGVIYILRHGFKDRGIEFKVCYFKPETTLNPETIRLYDENILECTRQLYYSESHPRNSVDMVLFLNGIPLVCLELKCNQSGQNVKHAIKQYREDRDPIEPLFEFRNRIIVYFAVDHYETYMTTRLLKKDTYFLPFNQGSNGCGNVGGKGNPSIGDGMGYSTKYLWENILTKDSLMEKSLL